jgi:SWIM zinc finger
VVTIEADPGAGVPGKRELWIRCTCPDDTGAGNEACKHAVAALFALSDEVATEPELLERWRGGSRSPRPTAAAPAPPALPSNVVPIRRDRPVIEPDPEPRDDSIDEIARLLIAPGGAGAPEFPDASMIEHRSMRDRTIADVLNDALDHLMIRWD